jgi:hypothetical protein
MALTPLVLDPGETERMAAVTAVIHRTSIFMEFPQALVDIDGIASGLTCLGAKSQ